MCAKREQQDHSMSETRVTPRLSTKRTFLWRQNSECAPQLQWLACNKDWGPHPLRTYSVTKGMYEEQFFATTLPQAWPLTEAVKERDGGYVVHYACVMNDNFFSTKA